MSSISRKWHRKTVSGIPDKSGSLVLIDKSTSYSIWKFLDSNHASDCVVIKSEKQIDQLIDLLEIKSKNNQVPADLFFGNTVPLKDFLIEDDITLPGYQVRFTVNSESLENLNDEIKNIEQSEDPELILARDVAIVSIINKSNNAELAFPILVAPGVDYTFVGQHVTARRPGKKYDTNLDKEALRYFRKATVLYLGIWYVIQLLLLHPEIKEVLVPEDTKEELSESVANRPFRTPYTVRNIRRVRINEELEPSKLRARNWHVSTWYNIGFWRRAYGKLTFVQGHWKHRHHPVTSEEIPVRERIVE